VVGIVEVGIDDVDDKIDVVDVDDVDELNSGIDDVDSGIDDVDSGIDDVDSDIVDVCPPRCFRERLLFFARVPIFILRDFCLVLTIYL
jgi:hypothetical protein